MKPSKKQVAAAWDQIAMQYSSYNRKSWKKFDEFLQGSNGPILDVGCGNASYENVIGLDLSFQSCKLARKRIEVVCGDAVFLPFKSVFSAVISRAMIHHLPSEEDRIGFLQEVRRVLKSDGKALITCWYRWQWKHMPKALFSKTKWESWGKARRFYHLFSKSELGSLASKVFKEYEVEVEKGNLYLYARK